MNGQSIDISSRQNPRNYTHQLQQRHANRILAHKLVNIKPMVDTKMPSSYKTQKAREQCLRERHSTQMASISQSLEQQNRSIELTQSLQGVAEFETSFNNGILDDPLCLISTNREGGPSPFLNQNEQSLFDPYGDAQMIERGRQATDSLMSNQQVQMQQDSQQSKLQAGGSSLMQQQSSYRPNRVEKQRLRQIESDNQVLLKKMIQIMNRRQNAANGVPRISKYVTANTSQSTHLKNRIASTDATYAGPNPGMLSMRGQQDQRRSKHGRKVSLAPKLKQKLTVSDPNQVQIMMDQNSYRQSAAAQSIPNNVYAGQHIMMESSKMSDGKDSASKDVVVPGQQTGGTLNFSNRKKQIDRINHENLQMLRTLQQTKPTISFDHWANHARRQECYKKNISLSRPSGGGPSAFSGTRSSQRQTCRQFIPDLDRFAMMNAISNGQSQPIRQPFRANVKSGSLPQRSNFYVHTRQPGSKKANSSHTYAGGFRGERLSNKLTSPTQRSPQQMYPVQQPFAPIVVKTREQPETSAFDGSTEVTQKIASCINMFPQPTDEQLDQFKELHDNSGSCTDMITNTHPASKETFQNDAETITNIQVCPADNKSDNQMQATYDFEMIRAKQGSQVVSQPIVDQNVDPNDQNTAVINAESRRVQTTLPGMRRRKVDPGSPEKDSGVMRQIGTAAEIDRDLGLDIKNFEKPNSMNQSLNSTSQVPQIIIRQGGRVPGWTGCNPMLIPIDEQNKSNTQQYMQQQKQPSFYPQPYLNEEMNWIVNGQQQYPEPCEDQGDGESASISVPKANFYDYQYQEGPNYKISFDPLSGQPKYNNMDALQMNQKLVEMQNEISQRRCNDNSMLLMQHQRAQKMQQQVVQKKKNVKQILKAYAFNNSAIGPYGTNNNVISQLQSRKVPTHNRKVSLAAKAPTFARPQRHQQQRASQFVADHQQHVTKRNMRAQTHSRSPPKNQLQNRAQANATQQIAPQSHRYTTLQQTVTHEDDQVGGGPVSPDILRLQANRPDERQQRNRIKKVSHEEVQAEPLAQQIPSHFHQQPPPLLPPQPQKPTQQTELAGPASVYKNIIKVTQKQPKTQQFTSVGQTGKLPNQHQMPQKPSQFRAVPKSQAARNSIKETSKLFASTGQYKQPNHKRTSNSTDSHDQRASSTIEEGIMGLKYLPAGQSPQNDELKVSRQTAATPMAQAEDASLEETNVMNRFESKQTSLLTIDAIAPKMEIEDTSGTQSYQITSYMPGCDGSGAKASSESNQMSPVSRIPHQETQVGLMQPGHIEDQPIHVDLSDQQSNTTDPNRLEVNSQYAERRRLSSGCENLIPERSNDVRQSIGTDGAQNPYSDFDEEEDEKAAVGSGIVETNDDYEDDECEGVDIDEINSAKAQSREELKHVAMAPFAHSEQQKPQSAEKPASTIAQLLQQRQQLTSREDDESNYSDNDEAYQSHVESRVSKIQAADQEQRAECDQFMESGSHEMSHTDQFVPKAMLEKADYEIDDEEDYDQDFQELDVEVVSRPDKKMSLESDQDAPENEFEQIKDEDYADEDDDQDVYEEY